MGLAWVGEIPLGTGTRQGQVYGYGVFPLSVVVVELWVH